MAIAARSRVYRSAARTRQAEHTRGRILEAAGELFLADGYVRTKTSAIAVRAGVSEASVFAVFGSKAALLAAVIGAKVAGTTAGRPLRESPRWRELAADHDPAHALALFAGLVREAHEQSWQLLSAARAAADSDPDLAAAIRRGGLARRSDCEWFATEVLRLPRHEPSTQSRIDVLSAQSSVDVFRLLVIERGWSADRYQQWLTELLTRELLPP